MKNQLVTYQIFDGASRQWREASLEELHMSGWRHITALAHLEEFEYSEPLSCAGRKVRAFWQDQSPECYPENSLIPQILESYTTALQFKSKSQQDEFRELFARFESEAKKRRDEIQKALVGVMTRLADAFEGSHNERHTKLARAMTQLYEVSALCEKIPDLLVDAADDIPF